MHHRGVTEVKKASSDDQVLYFDEELLIEKDLYVTLEDKFDKVFQHKSKAVCFECQKPLFNPLTQEKSKSLSCGKKFHLVSPSYPVLHEGLLYQDFRDPFLSQVPTIPFKTLSNYLTLLYFLNYLVK